MPATPLRPAPDRQASIALSRLEDAGLTSVAALPYSIRVLLEVGAAKLRRLPVCEDDVRKLAAWRPRRRPRLKCRCKPARVVLQDFTGVPAVVDLAAMRSAMKRLGGDPKRINPAGASRPGDRPLGTGRLGSARPMRWPTTSP